MSARNTKSGGVQAAARRLGELLAVRPDYRRLWEEQTRKDQPEQDRGPGVQQAAVARVLVAHLLATGQIRPERTRARRLKDLVGRALSGRVLSVRTLELFVGAFAMSTADAEELRGLLDNGRARRGARLDPRASCLGFDPEPTAGSPRPDSTADGDTVGRRGVPDPSHEQPGPAAVAEGQYRTVSLHEVQTLGPDGLPRTTRTVHVIRAVQLLTGYSYLLAPGTQRLDVLRGGRAGRARRVNDRAAVNIVFHHPLPPGETASLEYICRFLPGATGPAWFRRGTRTRLENVELQVRFHPLRLPDRIWWTVWPDDLAEHPTQQEAVQLDQDGTVHRFVEIVERQAIGFRWRFPT
jgi:hypothetical protein